jgi:hypothetical protein
MQTGVLANRTPYCRMRCWRYNALRDGAISFSIKERALCCVQLQAAEGLTHILKSDVTLFKH